MKRERGVALIIVLLLASLSLAISLYTALGARTEMALAHNDVLQKQALDVAEAGLTHAAQQIAAHRVPDDELAVSSGGACSAGGLGNAASGLAQIGSTVVFRSACYRFRAFGPASADGYYVRVQDDHDEASGSDNPLGDTNGRIAIVSAGSVGTAKRVVAGVIYFQPSLGFFGINNVTLSGGTSTDSYVGTYVPGAAGTSSSVGSNGNIVMSGSPTRVAGTAAAAGTVTTSGGALVTGTVTNGAGALSFPPATACAPYSTGSGITPSSAYDNATGNLQMSGGATVTLATGTYCFGNVSLSGGSTLGISGPTTINLTGTWNSSGGSVTNTTLVASNLRVNSSGDSVTVTRHSETYMTLYAPAADITISGSSPYFGTIIGRSLTATGGAALHQPLDTAGTAVLVNAHEVR